MPVKINYTNDSKVSVSLGVMEADAPTSIHFFSPSADNVALLITQSGKTVWERHLLSQPGLNTVPVYLVGFGQGDYEVTLMTSSRICKKKFHLD